MPVGDLTSNAVYCPVVGSTLQFDRNYSTASLSESMLLQRGSESKFDYGRLGGLCVETKATGYRQEM